MVNARKSFDDPIEFRAENGASQRPATPVHRRRELDGENRARLSRRFDGQSVRSSRLWAPRTTVAFKSNQGVLRSQYLKPGANQNALAKELKDGLAKLGLGFGARSFALVWFRDNDYFEP